MTTINPIPKAIHAAWCELSTPEARAWYKAKASQAQAIAAFVSTITSKVFVTLQSLLKPKNEVENPQTGADSMIEDAMAQPGDLLEQGAESSEGIAIAQPTTETEVEPVNEGINAIVSESLDQNDDPTELRPAAEYSDSPIEDLAEADATDDEVERYSEMADEVDSTEEMAHETVNA
jgi:hypothetical protein